MRRLIALAAVLVAVLATAIPAYGAGGFSGGGARGGGFSGGSSAGRSSSSSSSSSSSRSSGSSSSSSAPKSGSGGVRPSTPAQPSSGRIAQPAPAGRMVPRSLPPNVRTPAGRNFVRDRAALARNPRYLDPYDSAYYGNPGSPYFYMYLAALNDNDPGNNPVRYQVKCKPQHRGVATWVFVLCLILALIIGAVVGFFLSEG